MIYRGALNPIDVVREFFITPACKIYIAYCLSDWENVKGYNCFTFMVVTFKPWSERCVELCILKGSLFESRLIVYHNASFSDA